jgi:hypothetical protein
MKVSSRRVKNAMVVDVLGRPELPGSKLVDAVDGLLERREKRIVLNFVTSGFDSSCLGEAVVCHLNARRRGAQVKVAVPEKKVGEVIRALKLARVLDCFPNEDEALKSFSV